MADLPKTVAVAALSLAGVTYQLEYVACGSTRCKKQPDRHGPYWYAYWWDPARERTRSRYVGKQLPSAVAEARNDWEQPEIPAEYWSYVGIPDQVSP